MGNQPRYCLRLLRTLTRTQAYQDRSDSPGALQVGNSQPPALYYRPLPWGLLFSLSRSCYPVTWLGYVQCCAVGCCEVLCRAVPWCAVRCCGVRCRAVQCCAVLILCLSLEQISHIRQWSSLRLEFILWLLRVKLHIGLLLDHRGGHSSRSM